jgi:pimeloyl-ACP methyl ester carboxylesterase
MSKPVLILPHKSASSSIFMKTLIYHCTALDYDIYAQDIPGFGGSFHPNKVIETFTKEQSTKRYCNLCAIMCTNLGIRSKRGCTVVGSSQWYEPGIGTCECEPWSGENVE